MSANRKQLFYEDGTGLTSSYKDNKFDLEVAAKAFVFYVEGGELSFSVAGADDSLSDGVIIPAHTANQPLMLPIEASRISLKQVSGTVTRWQVWGLP